MSGQPYIGLIGNYGGAWRSQTRLWFQAQGLCCQEPESAGWDEITAENGDAKQALIDQLVARQHELMFGASCILYNLDAFDSSGRALPALAARCELGFLAGIRKRSFVYIDTRTVGRNYLWAQIKPYPQLTRCHTLAEAQNQAAAWFRENKTS